MAGLAQALRFGVGAQVHVGGVKPHEKRRAGGVLRVDVVQAVLEDVVVDGLHSLLGQRPESSIRGLPTRPQRGCSVGSSSIKEEPHPTGGPSRSYQRPGGGNVSQKVLDNETPRCHGDHIPPV